MSYSRRRLLRRSTAVTAAVIVGLLGAGLTGTANAATTTVTGSVKTSDGTGVAGVKVSIKVGTRKAVTTKTNSNGSFSANVNTGNAKITLVGPATPAADLPQKWSFKRIRTTVENNSTFNLKLPATTPLVAKVAPGGMPVAGAAITQCSNDRDAANKAVVLNGSPGVAPKQEFTGATTDAAGETTLSVFPDASFGRLCGTFSDTVDGAVTTYVARSGVKDTSTVSSMTLFLPTTATQGGTVKDGNGDGAADLKVAIRSAGGQVDSISAPTSASGVFSTQIAPGNVYARFSGRSLSSTVAPPPTLPRSFKATIDGTADGSAPWDVQLPSTVTLTVVVENADGTPVKNAVVRPLKAGDYVTADPASLVSGQPDAILTQQVYGDNLSGADGAVAVRLFPDSSLGAFRVIKNLAGTSSRETTVTAGTVVVTDTEITVVLPPAT